MTEEERLKTQIANLHEQWDLLTKKLSKLEKEKIFATEPGKFELENKIGETKNERQQVEEELKELESKILQKNKGSGSGHSEGNEDAVDENIPENVQKDQLHEIEFVNRASEIQFITNIHCPEYLLISAPMEYGKTRLLEAVKFQLQQNKRFCIHVTLSRKRAYSIRELAYEILQKIDEKQCNRLELLSPEQAGAEIGDCIVKQLDENQKHVLLIVDEAEAINEPVAEVFLNQLILMLHETLSIHSVYLTSIFAGRYIANWTRLAQKFTLVSQSLTPFDFPAVLQTVENFVLNQNLNIPPSDRVELASHLMSFTGGDPGCMARILIADSRKPLPVIISNEDKYYKTIVKPVIDEIIENMPPGLEEVFDTLCAVRRFNGRLLQRFIDKSLINWPKSGADLEKFLLKKYLVNRDRGFLKDEITQRLLAIRLRREKFDHFRIVCEESIAFYASQLEIPNLSSGLEILTVELLFQKMQSLFYKEHGRKEQFLEIIPVVLDKLVFNRDNPAAIMDTFIEILENDWEFRFTYDYLFREQANESLFKKFIQHVKDFREHLQGENNA